VFNSGPQGKALNIRNNNHEAVAARFRAMRVVLVAQDSVDKDFSALNVPWKPLLANAFSWARSRPFLTDA